MDFTPLTRFLDSLPEIAAPGVDCIVLKGHETVFRHHAGFADRETRREMAGGERFFLYSTTKPITCTAVMQLCESGRLLLTDPISEYLPEFREMLLRHTDETGQTVLVPAKKPITVADLLTMTSGMDYDLQAPAISEAILRGGTTREIVRALAKCPLWFEPGTRWQYSMSHDVLGALIEVVSGQSFGDYLKTHIFDPLGMDATGFALTDAVRSRMMTQYRRDPDTGAVSAMPADNPFILSPRYESGGAGLISTVDDYAKFAAALTNNGQAADGTRILSPAAINLMRTNRLDEVQLRDFNWPQLAGYGYGLGVRTLISPSRGGSLSPVGEFGWDGAAGCYVLMDPENRLTLFYAQQMLPSMCEYIHPRLRNLLYGCL